MFYNNTKNDFKLFADETTSSSIECYADANLSATLSSKSDVKRSFVSVEPNSANLRDNTSTNDVTETNCPDSEDVQPTKKARWKERGNPEDKSKEREKLRKGQQNSRKYQDIIFKKAMLHIYCLKSKTNITVDYTEKKTKITYFVLGKIVICFQRTQIDILGAYTFTI